MKNSGPIKTALASLHARPKNRPTSRTWSESVNAAFVNWLNTSEGYQAAYNLTFSSGWSMTLWGATDQATTGVDNGTNSYRHKDAFYFLPSEDEWYKAAFHQNDGFSANYWDYAMGSNTAPTAVASGTTSGTAVYNGQADPADVNQVGGLSPYGTMGQNGNVGEWSESAFDGSNDSPTENRAVRGGHFASTVDSFRSSNGIGSNPANHFGNIGFRVASVSEPSAALLALMAGGAFGCQKPCWK